MMNKEALNAYIAAIGNIQDDLDAIQEYINNNVYEDVSPEDVNFGHVNFLGSIEYRLAEIVAELYPEKAE